MQLLRFLRASRAKKASLHSAPSQRHLTAATWILDGCPEMRGCVHLSGCLLKVVQHQYQIVSGLCETLCFELLPARLLEMSLADLESECRSAIRQAFTKSHFRIWHQCYKLRKGCCPSVQSWAAHEVLVPRFCLVIGTCSPVLEAQPSRPGRTKPTLCHFPFFEACC